MSTWAARAKAHFAAQTLSGTTKTGETTVLGVLGVVSQHKPENTHGVLEVLGVATDAAVHVPPVVDPLVWLRGFLGSDTVQLTSIKAAALKAGVRWSAILPIAPDYVIDQTSMDKVYWKLARMNPKRGQPQLEGSQNGQF